MRKSQQRPRKAQRHRVNPPRWFILPGLQAGANHHSVDQPERVPVEDAPAASSRVVNIGETLNLLIGKGMQ